MELIKNILLKEGIDEQAKFSVKAEILLSQQLQNWKLAQSGYNSLSSVQVKNFEFDGLTIEAHFNPGRIISSSAKVDAKSIEARPCFLCPANLPSEQKALNIVNDYILLVNPFPIFPKHFTIPSINHVPQLVYSQIENMLIISKMVEKKFTLFYNGPKCGASAPDHLHFQAGNFGFMKIDTQYEAILKKYGTVIYDNNECVINLVVGALRNYISIESKDINEVIKQFQRIYSSLKKVETDEEPLLNIICTYNDSWRLIIFPRSKHRPTYFFEEGEKKVLISPAAVDLGGVMIFPREEDFEKISKELIIDVFNQVTLNKTEFELLKKKLTKV